MISMTFLFAAAVWSYASISEARYRFCDTRFVFVSGGLAVACILLGVVTIGV